jgi:hypothetical protein
MKTFLSEHFSVTDLQDIRQLCDVDTEEAQADLWTRHRLTPGAALDLLAEVDSKRITMSREPSNRKPRQRKAPLPRRTESWRVSA